MCLRDGMPKTTVFSLSLSCGTTHATSKCQTEVRENAVSKYHFPYVKDTLICLLDLEINQIKTTCTKIIFELFLYLPITT